MLLRVALCLFAHIVAKSIVWNVETAEVGNANIIQSSGQWLGRYNLKIKDNPSVFYNCCVPLIFVIS